jgi:non-ribosomal peptide synthetase component F
VSPELGQAARAAGRALRTTPFTVFAAAMAGLLWQYGEQEEVIFGTPVSLRGTAAVDGMIGFLTNLHPIRLAVSRDMSFRTLVTAAKAEILSAIEHRAVPYSTIVRMSRRGLDPDAPLCDVSLVLDDMSWEPFSLPELTAEPIRVPEQYAKYAVHLILKADDDGGYTGVWNYDAEVYGAATMARVAGEFVQLLSHCVAAPDLPLGDNAGSTA